MRRQDRFRIVLLAGLAACASVDPGPDHEEARRRIRESTGRTEVYDPQAPVLSPDAIDAVLDGGLTLDEALTLALLNNRRLQAGFARVGVARADLVQAGLLSNPSLGIAFLFPTGGGRPQVTVDLVEDLLAIWELPARERIASAELAEEVLALSRHAGEIVAATKEAYLTAVAARELREIAEESAEVARLRSAALRERSAAGVATEAEASLAAIDETAAEIGARRARIEELTAKRRLAAMLSLEADLIAVELTDALPTLSPLPEDREALVARALDRRLDLHAAAAALEAAREETRLESRRVLPAVEAGIAAERPEEGGESDLLLGPGASVELPLFDRNQARAAGARYRQEALEKELEALRAEIAQEVRAGTDRAAEAARVSRSIELDLLPRARRAVEAARSAFESGDATRLAVLGARRLVGEARSDLVAARLEAACARAELERRVGAPLD